MSTTSIHVITETPMQVGECPIWSIKEQSLYWIDINGCKVHRWNETSQYEWMLPSQPGCIAFCDQGGLIVATRHGIVHLNTASGELTPIADAPYDTEKFRFNDGRCDAHGRLWLGTLVDARDHAGASLFRLTQGTLSDLYRPCTVSNGVAFAPDGRSMFHSDTTSHTIYRYQLGATDGVISDASTFQSFSKVKDASYGGRPDGGAVDSEGNYWVAMFEGARLLCFAANGNLLREVALPVRCPTMVAFGGPDLRTLFVTSASANRSPEEIAQYPLSGHVLALRVDVPGQPEHAYTL